MRQRKRQQVMIVDEVGGGSNVEATAGLKGHGSCHMDSWAFWEMSLVGVSV